MDTTHPLPMLPEEKNKKKINDTYIRFIVLLDMDLCNFVYRPNQSKIEKETIISWFNKLNDSTYKNHSYLYLPKKTIIFFLVREWIKRKDDLH